MALILFTTVDKHQRLPVESCVGAHVEVIHLSGYRRRTRPQAASSVHRVGNPLH
jgi:hypothetical protein